MQIEQKREKQQKAKEQSIKAATIPDKTACARVINTRVDMRKDSLIAKKLDMYAEQCKPEADTVLEPARQALSLRAGLRSGYAQSRDYGGTRQKTAKRWPVWKTCVSLIFVALLVVEAAITIVDFDRLFSPPGSDSSQHQPKTYALSSLTAAPAAEGEAESILGAAYLSIPSSAPLEYAMDAILYSDEESADVAVFRYRVVTEHGADEALLIADIGGGLTDYQMVKTAPEIYGLTAPVQVKGDVGLYVDGEYLSALYFSYKSLDYYLIIMSPYGGAAQFYLNLFFSAYA